MVTKTSAPKDCFALMEEDHRKVKQLFKDMDKAKDGKSRMSIFEDIKMELDAHTHMEEKSFYPAIKDEAPTHDLTLEAYQEHHVVKMLLKELSTLSANKEEWMAKFEVLKENVEHHIEEEEDKLFPRAKKILGKRIKELGLEMKNIKDAF